MTTGRALLEETREAWLVYPRVARSRGTCCSRRTLTTFTMPPVSRHRRKLESGTACPAPRAMSTARRQVAGCFFIDVQYDTEMDERPLSQINDFHGPFRIASPGRCSLGGDLVEAREVCG